MILNKQRIIDFFKKSEHKADSLLKNKKQARNTIQDALDKAVTNKGKLEGVWTKMLLLMGVAKDYINGDYTEIPKRSIIAIIGGLIYFLSPIDIVPDFVPVLGFIDDIFILNLVYKQVLKDLEAYKIWKENQHKIIQLNGSNA